MFCPKCGMKNSETGKFCRGCGTDLATVSDALSGKSNNKMAGFGMIEPIQPINLINKKGKSATWESAMSTLFTGFAFLVISIILGVSGVANASRWWFWLLIPAFAMIGAGVAQFSFLRKNDQKGLPAADAASVKSFDQTQSEPSLPPIQTAYVAPDSRYKTGDLVPPSVTDNTTRHLELNSEGETMTLPKNKFS